MGICTIWDPLFNTFLSLSTCLCLPRSFCKQEMCMLELIYEERECYFSLLLQYWEAQVLSWAEAMMVPGRNGLVTQSMEQLWKPAEWCDVLWSHPWQQLFHINQVASPNCRYRAGHLRGTMSSCAGLVTKYLVPSLDLMFMWVSEKDLKLCALNTNIIIAGRLKFHSPESHYLLKCLKSGTQDSAFGLCCERK